MGAGIALLAVIAMVFSGDGDSRTLAEASQAEAAVAVAKPPSAPKVALTASDRQRMHSQISSLKAKVESEEVSKLEQTVQVACAQKGTVTCKRIVIVCVRQAKASKLDKIVREEEGTIKEVVLKAKKMEEEAQKAKKKAVERTQKVHMC